MAAVPADLPVNDTIFALASGMPPAAIAVVRISGPDAMSAASALAGSLPPPRRASLRRLGDPANGETLDDAIMVCFPGPATATGEDLVELHLHGGRAVVRAVESALAALPGLRGAEPGEFTRRALAHGRIDLAEAEGLGDLLSAQTERQRRAAMMAVEGKLSQCVGDWTDRVLVVAARVEASLDFADEDDVGDELDPCLRGQLTDLAQAIGAVLEQPPVERLRDGIRVVLAGPRNAGKSTLLNALVERDAAIVSPIAGTTRDVIEVPAVRGGIAYVLTDTAGIAEATADPVEAIGIARARAATESADILLWLDDMRPPGDAIWLYPRGDIRKPNTNPDRITVSGMTGEGLAGLWQMIDQRARDLLPREDRIALNERQRSLAESCRDALVRAATEQDPLLVAEHLRLARRMLDRITGRADVEAMLGSLFSRFCIGK